MEDQATGPETAGIQDRAMLAEVKDLGDDIFKELVQLYLQEGPGRLERIRNGIESGDGALASQAAHSLKGSSASFGASGLAKLAEKIELAGKDGDLATCKAVFPEVEAEYERVRAGLSSEAGL
ncbi:MAG: Hpt domain-containing protein [Actinomycetota bacterium]